MYKYALMCMFFLFTINSHVQGITFKITIHNNTNNDISTSPEDYTAKWGDRKDNEFKKEIIIKAHDSKIITTVSADIDGVFGFNLISPEVSPHFGYIELWANTRGENLYPLSTRVSAARDSINGSFAAINSNKNYIKTTLKLIFKDFKPIANADVYVN